MEIKDVIDMRINMRRITTKLDNGFYVCKDKIMTCEGGIRQTQILGIYEDIEEELGCPLEALFKAMSDKIIYVPYQDSDSYTAIRPRLMRIDEGYFIFDLVDGYEIKLSDYKKSWWLTEDRSE